jgi:hypothetical protein
VAAASAHLDRDDGDWVVLRVSDPDEPAGTGAGQLAHLGRSIAYSSPFWLDPPPGTAAAEAARRAQPPVVVVDGPE